jgi:methyl-accepting chemotaxis protein
MIKPKFSIRKKITISMISIIIIFALGFGITLFSTLGSFVSITVEKDMAVIGKIMNQSINSKFEGDWQVKNNTLFKGDTEIQDMYTQIKSLHVLNSGFLSIAKPSGEVLIGISPDGEKMNLSSFDFSSIDINSKINLLTVNDELYSSFFFPIKEGNNTIAYIIYGTSLDSKGNIFFDFIKHSLNFLVVMLIIIGFLVYFITKPITKNLKLGTQACKSLKNGDLTYRVDTTKINDEIGLMLNSLNEASESLGKMVSVSSNNAKILSKSSNQMSTAFEQVTESVEHVALKVEDIAQTAMQNASSAEETTANIQELAASAEMVADKSDYVSNNANTVVSLSEDGAKQIDNVVESINSIQVATQNVANEIMKLKKSSIKIGDFLDIINEISDQTNMLALNASIEAARAGEHGKGFAVVADQIRKLAEETKGSSEKVREIVFEIQKEAEDTVSRIAEGEEAVANGVLKSNDSKKAFLNILDAIREIRIQIQEIAETSKQQSNISKEMATSIETFSHLSQKTASDVQEINADVEEQYSTFEELTAIVQSLDKSVDELENELETFKL